MDSDLTETESKLSPVLILVSFCFYSPRQVFFFFFAGRCPSASEPPTRIRGAHWKITDAACNVAGRRNGRVPPQHVSVKGACALSDEADLRHRRFHQKCAGGTAGSDRVRGLANSQASVFLKSSALRLIGSWITRFLI